MLIQAIALALLLALSAFFSGSETAFFSMNQFEKEKLARQTHGSRRNFIARILDSPAEILITILTGNMVVNLFFASITDRFVTNFSLQSPWLYSILFGSLLVLIFGEMTPKNLAIRHSLPFFSFASRALRPFHSLLTPVRFVLRKIEYVVTALLSGRLRSRSVDERSLISSTFQIGLQKGILQRSEHSVLESFLDFREKTAEEVMVPRTEMNAIDVRTAVKTLVARAKRLPDEIHLPVYKENLDHIVGYVNIRDLLPYHYKLGKIRTISTILRPIHAVPDSKNLMELMRELMQKNCDMALVVDEYGGTAGVVTFQNLVEDFLYFFYPAKEEYQRIDNGVFLFPGHFELERLSGILGVDFDSESRTISGLITERLEEIPSVDAVLRVDGYLFRVKEVSRKKVLEVEVSRVS